MIKKKKSEHCPILFSDENGQCYFQIGWEGWGRFFTCAVRHNPSLPCWAGLQVRLSHFRPCAGRGWTRPPRGGGFLWVIICPILSLVSSCQWHSSLLYHWQPLCRTFCLASNWQHCNCCQNKMRAYSMGGWPQTSASLPPGWGWGEGGGSSVLKS